jgi:hypothetical protein
MNDKIIKLLRLADSPNELIAELSDELLRAMEELELFPPLIRYRIECEWESEDPEWEPEDEKK